MGKRSLPCFIGEFGSLAPAVRLPAMSAAEAPLGFSRPEGPEDISPPPAIATKSRSFESLSVAKMLQSKMLPTASGTAEPSSPTMALAVAALQQASADSKGDSDEDAIGCLMALSSSDSKRKAYDSESVPAPRRRLKMRMEPSPLPLGPTRNNKINTLAATPPQLLSSANVQQLKLLAAAFKLCPSPSAQQLEAVAQRVGLPVDRIEQWFTSRQVGIAPVSCISCSSLLPYLPMADFR